MLSRRFLCSLLTLAGSASADLTATLTTGQWGVWEGWGTSLAWWAVAFGDRDDVADLFFSRNTINFNGQNAPGLGLNIVRYNVGASSNKPANGVSMALPSTMNPSRLVEAYWLDWNSADPNSASWNWFVDANQRNMMWKARDRGANVFEIFSNAPPFWMLGNKNPAGADNGKNDNLQSWNHKDFAVYLATVSKYARDQWGINFQSIEPFNEPSASWWSGKTGTQEGCHFDVKTQATVINLLRAEMDARGLQDQMIAASDENSYDAATSTLRSLISAGAAAKIGRVNVHGYQYGGGDRQKLYETATGAGKRLWQSEYGKGDDSGADLVSNLILDFRWMRPTAWVYWQLIDGGGWGTLDGDNNAKRLGAVNQKHYLLALFTRHIRPGMIILDSGEYNVAAYDAAARKLVIVAVNWQNAQYLNFDLSRFSRPGSDGALVPRWSTMIGSGEQYVQYSDTRMVGNKFWSLFQKNQVQTFEISNVSL
ncbi:hypothetical protein RB595_005168 [Gaeumannomyces hyphopodioides]